MSPFPATAFKILTGAEWESFQADGRFEGSPVDRADGYIHLSAADQIEATLGLHYPGQSGLVLAEVDLGALGDSVRWEKSRGGACFPHVYDILPLSAVLRALHLPAQA